MKLKNKLMVGVLLGLIGFGMGYSLVKADEGAGTVSPSRSVDKDLATGGKINSKTSTPTSQSYNEITAVHMDPPSLFNPGQSSTGNANSPPSAGSATGNPMNQ